MSEAPAYAKVNLTLLVGPTRTDGLHDVATVLQRVDLADTISVESASELSVEGFADDTLVRGALEALAAATRTEPNWRARIEKRIPVAGGLGGGSSDAATALRLAHDALGAPLARDELHAVAASLGADVPFFVEPGPKLATGTGTSLRDVDLPQNYAVLLLLPRGAVKESTAAVYARYDGASGFEERNRRLLDLLAATRLPRDLARLPPNDLASSSLATELLAAGAFRADVSGAGPVLYGLFDDLTGAERAASELSPIGHCWAVRTAW